MKTFFFYLIYPIVWLWSIMPMWILYRLSDFLYFIIYYIVGYRKKVIANNIEIAFPEKSPEEKKLILKKFYRHFTDILVESIKAFTITESFVKKRYTYKNPELVNKYIKEGKSIALVGAHLSNWEWSISLPLVLDGKIFGAYSKLRNEMFEKKLKESREKFGVIGAKTSVFMGVIKQNHENNVQGIYLLLSDQSPKLVKAFHWDYFFKQYVPVHTGADMLAQKYDLVVINYRSKKLKRGYFEVDFELVTDTPQECEKFEITQKFLRITERNVAEQPEFYLWSHRRFKHRNSYENWQKMMEAKKKQKSN